MHAPTKLLATIGTATLVVALIVGYYGLAHSSSRNAAAVTPGASVTTSKGVDHVVAAPAVTVSSAPASFEITGEMTVQDFSNLALDGIENANGFNVDQPYNALGNDDEGIRFLNSLTAGTTYSCADGLASGYEDVAAGTGVTVTDGTGQLIATGDLTGGVLDAEGCHFQYQITVPQAAFYQITVSHRGALSYSFAQMQAAGWKVSSHLT